MDTPEKYIKMCKEAWNIQNDWEPEHGDTIWLETYDRIVLYGKRFLPEDIGSEWWIASDGVGPFSERGIWLLRQDQLQEMVDYSNRVAKSIFYYVDDLHNFYFEEKPEVNSMEQLWLAFVMHEKYGKVWNQEKGRWEHD